MVRTRFKQVTIRIVNFARCVGNKNVKYIGFFAK